MAEVITRFRGDAARHIQSQAWPRFKTLNLKATKAGFDAPTVEVEGFVEYMR
jgi:hypothetical protein